MTDKKKYDKAKQSIENIKKTIPVGDPLFKPMTKKYFAIIDDLERKQKQKLMKKGTSKKPKPKEIDKTELKRKQNLTKKIGINESEFNKLEKWGDKRLKNKIEYGTYFDKSTGKVLTEDEIRGSKGQVHFYDKGKDYGTD